MRQKPTKTITSNYTTTDADCGSRIICNSSSALTITLHTATYRINFELEIDNIGAGDVACGGQIIRQYSHAHVGNNNGAAWVVVIGGGSLVLGESSNSAYRGDRGKTAYDHSQVSHAPSDAQKNSDITKEEIEAKLTGAISSHNHAGEIPSGGTTGQVLKKASSTDYNATWGDSAEATNGIPSGGTTNQLLAKNSNTDYDGKWMDAPAAANGIPTGGTAGQTLVKVDGTDFNAQWSNASGGAVESDWGQL